MLRRHFQICIIIKQLMMITMVMLSFSSLLSLMSESMSLMFSVKFIMLPRSQYQCRACGLWNWNHSVFTWIHLTASFWRRKKPNHLKYHSYPVRLYLHWGGLSQFSHIHRVRKHQNFRLKRLFWSYPRSYVLSPKVRHNQRGSHHLEPFPSFHPCRHVHL